MTLFFYKALALWAAMRTTLRQEICQMYFPDLVIQLKRVLVRVKSMASRMRASKTGWITTYILFWLSNSVFFFNQIFFVWVYRDGNCLCGNTYNTYGLASVNGLACTTACPSNAYEKCGGNAALSIYLASCACRL